MGRKGTTTMNVPSQQEIMAKYLMGKTASQQAQLSMMRTAFDRFDSNRSGKITAKEVQKRFRELGRASSEAVVLQWIKERDINQDGTVSFEEFVSSYGAIIQPARVTQDGQTGEFNVQVQDDHLTVDPR